MEWIKIEMVVIGNGEEWDADKIEVIDGLHWIVVKYINRNLSRVKFSVYFIITFW